MRRGRPGRRGADLEASIATPWRTRIRCDRGFLQLSRALRSSSQARPRVLSAAEKPDLGKKGQVSKRLGRSVRSPSPHGGLAVGVEPGQPDLLEGLSGGTSRRSEGFPMRARLAAAVSASRSGGNPAARMLESPGAAGRRWPRC